MTTRDHNDARERRLERRPDLLACPLALIPIFTLRSLELEAMVNDWPVGVAQSDIPIGRIGDPQPAPAPPRPPFHGLCTPFSTRGAVFPLV